MAKSKTKRVLKGKPAKGPSGAAKATPAGRQPPRAAAKPAAGPRTPTLNEAILAVRAIVPRYAPNTPGEAAAFAFLADDDRRADYGKRTKGVDIMKEASVVAVAIDDALTRFGATVAGVYAKNRFRFLLDALTALGEALEAPVKGAGRKEAVTTAAAREAAARAARKQLLRVMKSFAGHRPAEVAALDAAALPVGNEASGVSASIDALVSLARGWIALPDDMSAVLRTSAGLTAALVDGALAAAEALAAGGADVILAGRGSVNDSAQVNIREGAVTLEILEATRLFDALHEDTSGVIAALPLGESLRSVIRGRPKKAKAPTPPAPSPEPPSPGPTP